MLIAWHPSESGPVVNRFDPQLAQQPLAPPPPRGPLEGGERPEVLVRHDERALDRRPEVAGRVAAHVARLQLRLDLLDDGVAEVGPRVVADPPQPVLAGAEVL